MVNSFKVEACELELIKIKFNFLNEHCYHTNDNYAHPYMRSTLRKRLLTGTVPVNNYLLTGKVLVNNSLLTRTLLNVRRCWLSMPLGAGILHWVLAWHTIEKKQKSNLHPPPSHPAYIPLCLHY